MSHIINVQSEMYLLNCSTCDIEFAIPNSLDNKLRKCHNTFYCPIGHQNYYPAKSEEEKLKEQLKEANNLLQDLREQEQKRLDKSKTKRSHK